MKKITSIISGLLAALILSTNVFAAVPEPEPPAPPPAQCDMTFATGPAGKGYSKIFSNWKAVCPRVPVCEKNSEGGLDNGGLLVSKDADIGLMGVYTLQNMLDSDEAYKQLQIVASMHSNLLHILTLESGFDLKAPDTIKEEYMGLRKVTVPGVVTHVDIGKFTDLKGRLVGVVGSAQFVARKLDKTSGHGMQFIDFESDAKAVESLKAGKIFAVLTMAAWPHGYIDKLKSNSGLKLVSYDLQPTAPLFLAKKAYKGLGQYKIDFLAEPNVLVTRPFTPGGQNAKNVAAVKSCMAANLGDLKDGRPDIKEKFEPAWNEITDLGQTYNLPVFSGGVGIKPKK